MDFLVFIHILMCLLYSSLFKDQNQPGEAIQLLYMNRHISISLICILFLITNLDAQYSKKIDSLLTVLKTLKEDTSKANTLNNLSAYNGVIGQYNKAKDYAESALMLSEKLKFKKGIATAYYQLGSLFEARNNLLIAVNHYNKALEVSQASGNIKIQAYAMHGLAIIYSKRGNISESLKYYFGALNINEQQGDKIGMGNNYGGIGLCYFRLGDYPKALQYYSEALKLGEAHNDNRLVTYINGNMGLVYQKQGDFPKALKAYLVTLRLSEQSGDKPSIGNSHNQLGIIYAKQGNADNAIKNYMAAVDISKSLGDKHGLALTYCNIGSLYADQNKVEEAHNYYNEAMKLREEMGDLQGLASTKSNLASIYLGKGNLQEAEILYASSLELTKQTGDRHGVAVSYVNMATVSLKQKDFSKAQNYFDSSLMLGKIMRSKELIRNAYAGMAVLDTLRGDYKSAFYNAKNATIYKDSLLNIKNSEEIVRLQMNYDFAKKEDSLIYQQELTNEVLKHQTLLSVQQKQQLEIQENKLLLADKEKQLQQLVLLNTASELESEQLKNKDSEKQLTISEQEKKIQQTELNLQKHQLLLQTKELDARKLQRNILIGGAGLLLIALFLLYRNYRSQQKINLLIKEAAEKENVELQLQSLRAQLNPHFMFNSLNAIQELIVTERNELSQSYLERFAQLLRLLLENANHPFISIKKELHFIDLYLSLEKLRIPDLEYKVILDHQIDPDTTIIPNMMLQPYIENSLWHGLQHKKGQKLLEIEITKTPGAVKYQIKDNGVGRDKAAELKKMFRKGHTSKGMELLSKRFALLSKEYGNTIQPEINDLQKDEQGTIVSIVVPESISEPTKLIYDSNHHH